ncbi:FHA domain-containing protein [Sulfurimonas sp.]|uniref:FHA domain-containing protein n=1 Tax=Sulfurimonas sp. TaxID=2022749 RepID=UPI00261480CC|nr:FHA domain-containing protein [Sulfurimonas sp.]
MLDEEKKKLLESMIPKAVLKAMTEEAKHSIIKREFSQDIIPIYDYPFKIGREARVQFVNGEVVLQERHKLSGQEPNNDVYLLDNGEYLQISREHCSIVKNEDGSYILYDRGSACGSMVNDIKVGGEDHSASAPLKDGDIISLGIENSPYKFKFIILDVDYL